MQPTIKEIISSRRTIHQFKTDHVPDEKIIREAIDAARWAPNHHLTEPWMFYLIGPDTAKSITDLCSEIVMELKGKKAAQMKHRRWSMMPGWLVLTCKKSADRIREREDYAACSCAIENFMLYLWAEGIGVKWTTGDIIRDPRFFELLQIDQGSESVVGLFWYGYAETVPTTLRKPVNEIIRVL